MKNIECSREQELIDVVESQRWPDRTAPDLRSHVAECSICADIVDVVSALHADRDAVMENVQVPAASVVWWRAEVRARQEAARVAARPITLVLAFAAASTVGVGLALLGLVTPVVGEWLNWLGVTLLGLGRSGGFDLGSLSTLGFSPGLPALIVIGISIALAPVAVYFILSEE